MQRVLKGWNFRRILFLIAGGFIIFQSIMEKQWLGIFLGGYFASMGLFAFGCAGGACFGKTCDYPVDPVKEQSKRISDKD